jgi:acyl phosphate:glycerol-3-phosphate acyltransferase
MNYSLFSLALLTYLWGAVPFSLVVSKLKKVDLRKVGSGNIGATNVYRAMGFKFAFLVFFLDGLKGYVPTYLALSVSNEPLVHVAIGALAIIGHTLSIFVKFKGGKGAATGIGVLLALCPDVCLIVVVLAALMIWRLRIVSITTMTCSLLALVLLYFFGYPNEYIVVIGLLVILIFVRHRTNIVRLIKGEENKV